MKILQGLWTVIEAVARFFLIKVFRLKLSEEQIQGFLQFVKFGLVGLSNTVVSYLIYLGALFLFEGLGILPKIDYLVAQVIAFILSVLWSFFWNNKFVFKKDEDEHRNPWAALAKTYVSYAFTGLFLNTVLSIIWVDLLGISKLIAPIINLLVSVPINFFLNKLWAFKTDKKQ